MQELEGTDSPYEPTWESLSDYRIPEWYLDAKLGIFIHWGVYSVPAFRGERAAGVSRFGEAAEWYPRNMYQQGSLEFDHHIATYGLHRDFGYKDFIPMFRAERWDPKEWAALFAEAGARYVVPVAEHHDGFAMYDCSLSEWTAVKMGPKRDIVGELTEAVRQQGLTLGVSSHRAEHWWYFDGGMRFDSDVRDQRYFGLYGPAQPGPGDPYSLDESPPDDAFLRDWYARACELVDRYRPQIVWFDWWIQHRAFTPFLKNFAAYYYNRGREWGREVVINHKFQALPEGTAVLDIERGKLGRIRKQFWQTDTSMSYNSWSYEEHDDFRTVTSIVHDLVDITSKNGCLLLNVGPKADGTLPEEVTQRLLGLGEWLQINGEAIYGTRYWKTFGEGPTQTGFGSVSEREEEPFAAQDIRFTVKGNVLYAIMLGWPGVKSTVTSLRSASDLPADIIESVSLLGSDAPLTWSQDHLGLHVTLPAERPCDHACTLKITVKDKGPLKCGE